MKRLSLYLHDVVEKGGRSLERLRDAGFSPAIVAAVDALTRRDGEDDRAFVRRAAADPLARPIKQADLIDNRRQAAEMGLPTAKYEEGLALLTGEFERGGTDGHA